MSNQDGRPSYRRIGEVGAGPSEKVGTPEETDLPTTPEADENNPISRQTTDEVIRSGSKLADQLMRGFLRSEHALRLLKLPGFERVVHDRREENRPDKDATRGEDKNVSRRGTAATEPNQRDLEIKEGKAKEIRDKKYDNFFAERRFSSNVESKQTDAGEKLLPKFFKEIVKRFEEGKNIEKPVKDGEIKYAEKTLEMWRSFFQAFVARTTKKSADISEVQEFAFRGLVKKSDAKAVVISDILMKDGGKVEKFARFGVLYQKISSLLSKLMPGDVIEKAALSEGLASGKLYYLALQPPSAEQELISGMKPTQGIFAAEATEARVAEELGINLDKGGPGLQSQSHTLVKKSKKRGIGGFFKWLVGDEEPMLDTQGQFMPWWQWGTLKKPGGLSLKRAFYSAVIIGFILAILFLINQYLFGK